MKRLSKFVCLLLVVSGFCVSELSEASDIAMIAGARPVFAPEFAEIINQLDLGGAHFSVMDGQYEWVTLQPLFAYYQSMIEVIRVMDKGNMVSDRVYELGDTLPSRLGIDQLRAGGSSTIQLQGGGYRSRLVMQSVPNADGLLWRLAGDEVDVAEEIRTLPPTTQFMTRFSFDAPGLYASARDLVLEIPILEVQLEKLDRLIAEKIFPLDQFLVSFKRGFTIGLSLNPEAQWVVPHMPGIHIPEMGLVAVLSDVDGALGNWIIQTLRESSPLPMVEIEVDGQSVYSIEIPAPLPTVVALQFAQVDERLLIASSPLLMQSLLDRREGGEDAPLLAALEGASDTRASSGWVVGEGLTSTFREFQKSIMEKLRADAGDAVHEKIIGYMERHVQYVLLALPEVLLSRQIDDMILTAQLHKRPINPRFRGAQVMMIPGMIASSALPSFQGARAQASVKACLNNRRILNSAKDQWSIENNKHTGAVVTFEDIAEYMRSMPVCPSDGEYILGPIGTDTVCTVHGTD